MYNEIFAFIVFVMVRLCYCTKSFERDYFFEGNICSPTSSYFGQVSSHITCGAICDRDPNCIGFFHSNTDRHCYGVDTYLTPTSSCTSNPTYKFFMRHDCGSPPAYSGSLTITSTGIVRPFNCSIKYRPTVGYIACTQNSLSPGTVNWRPSTGICTELYAHNCVQDSDCDEIGGVCTASQCRCAQNLDYDPAQMYCIKRFKLVPGISGNGVTSGQLLMAVDGVWGNVCYDDWVWAGTIAVCKELNANYIYGGAFHVSTVMGQGAASSPTYRLKNLNCGLTGNRLFEQCKFDQIETGCNHDKDIGVTCYEHDITGSVRLNANYVKDTVDSEHRLEVLWDGTWGTVCRDNWGGTEGDVACKSIDPATPIKDSDCSDSCAVGPAGPYKINEVRCQGDELHVFFCENFGWNVTYSCPGQEIGLYCKP